MNNNNNDTLFASLFPLLVSFHPHLFIVQQLSTAHLDDAHAIV